MELSSNALQLTILLKVGQVALLRFAKLSPLTLVLQVTKPEKKAESEVETEDSEAEAATPSRGRGRKRKAGTPQPTDKKSKAAKKEEEVQGEFSGESMFPTL